MNIEHTPGKERGHFSAMEDGKEAGIMTYRWKNETTFVIDHTEVDPSFGGRGVGKKLVLAGVEYARENSFTIIPQCSFVDALFNKLESIQDVRD